MMTKWLEDSQIIHASVDGDEVPSIRYTRPHLYSQLSVCFLKWRVIKVGYVKGLPFNCYTLWSVSPLSRSTHALFQNIKVEQASSAGHSNVILWGFQLFAWDVRNRRYDCPTDDNMIIFTQLSNKSFTEYFEGLRNNALRCERVYDGYVLKCVL